MTKEMDDRMIDLTVDLELECGRVLSVVTIDDNRFREWEGVLPYYRNIRKEGVILWPTV